MIYFPLVGLKKLQPLLNDKKSHPPPLVALEVFCFVVVFTSELSASIFHYVSFPTT